MEKVIKVAKIGKSANSQDPNDFIFHSSYNSFKIIGEETRSITLTASTNNQSFNFPHSQSFIPLVAIFAKRRTASQVFLPNGVDVELWGAKLGWTGDIRFNYVSADATNITVNFDNAKTSAVDIVLRYFILELVN